MIVSVGEKLNFNVALAEWNYTGSFFDLEDERSACELCEHPDIKYQFEIRNGYTSKRMLVGSECIRKFSISAVDDSGEVLGLTESAKKVSHDRRTAIARAELRTIVNTLVALANVDQQFEIETFIDYFKTRGAFTPKQLLLLLWRLDKYSIAYSTCKFKIVLRRHREQSQIEEILDWQFEKLRPYLTPNQTPLCDELRTGR